MTELTDEEVFGPQPKPGEMTDEQVFGKSREMTDTDVMASPSLPSEYDLPEAFQDRMRRGARLDRAMKRIGGGIGEGYGPEPIGLSPEHVQQLQDAGVLTDYTRYPYGRFGPVSILGDATVNATANTLEFLMRATSAGIHGAGAAFGHLVEEMTGSEMEGTKAEHDISGMGEFALIEMGMGRFVRPHVGSDQIVQMQPIGGLPTAQDFRTAAQAMNVADPLRLVTEENLRNLWQERGIHPAEAVDAASRDAFLHADLTHPDPNPPDRSGLAQVTSSPMPAGTPRSELAKTGEAHIDALLDSAPVRQAIDSPIIDRSRDVPGGAAISTAQPLEKIQAAAVKIGDKVYTGVIHADALENAVEDIGELAYDAYSEESDGFVTTTGRFVDRHEASLIVNGRDIYADENLAEKFEDMPKWQQQEIKYLRERGLDAQDLLPLEEQAGRPIVNIDSRLPTSLTIDGATFDPAEPLAVRATVEHATKQILTASRDIKVTPRLRFEQLKALIEAGTPSTPSGFTRLWRGNRVGEVGQNPSFTNDLAGIALPFREGYGGDLSYVDVPTEKLPAFESKGAVAPGAEFMVPPEIAAAARVAKMPAMDAEAAARVAQEYGAKAESAWYAAHGIDQAKAEEALRAFKNVRVYHGTNEQFENLDIGKAKNSYEQAVFFAETPEQAKKYGERIVPADLDPRRGLHVDEKMFEFFAKRGDPVRGAIEYAKKQYQDYVIFDLRGEKTYAVFNSEALKQTERELTEKPTTVDRAQAREILTKAEENGELQPPVAGADLSAAVTPPGALPPLTVQPPPRPGSLISAARAAATQFLNLRHSIKMAVAPMATGSNAAKAIAKDFENAMYRSRWEWARVDQFIMNSPELKAARDRTGETAVEQRRRMWNAADEESVMRQLGETNEHMGLATLEPEERQIVEDLQVRSQAAWEQAHDLEMVKTNGLPAYVPRMLLNLAMEEGPYGMPLEPIGLNMRTRTGQMLHREHLTAEETEAAAKARVRNRMAAAGKTPDEIEAAVEKVQIARDIRSLPSATAKLEDAIAGRTMINEIEKYGRETGTDTVAFGAKPGPDWFTIDHPSFYRWEPRFKEGAPALDADGNIIFNRVPIYIHGDFRGPLSAVLTKPLPDWYRAIMTVKGKTMSVVMLSPFIHNLVEFGRAFPSMPGKVAGLRVYFQGNAAKRNLPYEGNVQHVMDWANGKQIETMTGSPDMIEAINAGMVPIGHRFFNQDITSIMEQPNLTPGRSWTAQVTAAVPGLFDPAAGTAVKAGVDKIGDIHHNTLLWDRIGDLQTGLYVNFRDAQIEKGVNRQIAAYFAAHMANRFAGALPVSAMSQGATMFANLVLFSRSFTMGNLGVMKDAFGHIPSALLNPILRRGGLPELGETGGLPRAVMAQIERHVAEGGATASDVETAKQFARGLARRKAAAVIALDIGLMYIGNSLLQSIINVMRHDTTADQEAQGYVNRFHEAMQETQEHPLGFFYPVPVVSQAMRMASTISATHANEPGKQDRIRIGYASDGTGVYMRNPIGKIGEEFTGAFWGPLDMIRRKLSPYARATWEIMANDKGFGHKVYDPDAELPEDQMHNAFEIAKVIVKSGLPEGQLEGGYDLVTGRGSDWQVNAARALGPFAGFTFSQGAPGGPAVGELYHAKSSHDYKVQQALPDIREAIRQGDIQGARDAMTSLGISPQLQRYYIRTTQNPALRLSPRALRDFQRYAPPANRQRMEGLRQ